MDDLIARSLGAAGDDYATSGAYELLLPHFTPSFPSEQVKSIFAAARAQVSNVTAAGVLGLLGARASDKLFDASTAMTALAMECSRLALQVARGSESPVATVAANALPLPAVFHFGPVDKPRWHAGRKFDDRMADFVAIVAITECRLSAIPNQEANGTRAEWSQAVYGKKPKLRQSVVPPAMAGLLERNRSGAIYSELSPGEVYLCHASVPWSLCGPSDAPFLAARIHFELDADESKHAEEWKALQRAGGFVDPRVAFGGLCEYWLASLVKKVASNDTALFTLFEEPPPWLASSAPSDKENSGGSVADDEEEPRKGKRAMDDPAEEELE